MLEHQSVSCLGPQADWTEHFWNTGDQLSSDDPPPPIIDVDTILRQLSVLESELDELESQANQQIENEHTEEDGERTETYQSEQQSSGDAPVREGVLAEEGGGVLAQEGGGMSEDVGGVASEGGSGVSGVTGVSPAAVVSMLVLRSHTTICVFVYSPFNIENNRCSFSRKTRFQYVLIR